MLSVLVVLLFAVPSRLVFAPLGGAGTPAQVLGMAALLWWAGHRLARRSAVVPQPIRLAVYFFAVAAGISYVAAGIRAIDPLEQRAADRGLLSLCALLGILLVLMDGVPSRARLDVLLRRLVVAGACVAALGLLQFRTGMPFTDHIKIPGLSENSELAGVFGRGGLNRISGTAVHPIEFGVVMSMMLPLAVHYAIFDTHRTTVRRWLPVAAIALAVPVSISRSAIVSTAVVLCFMLPTWTRVMRRRAYVAILGLLAGVIVAVPGMFETLTRMFSGISGDDSAASRTGSYELAWEFVERAPLFGRGHLTFLPKYRILDNQYLLTLIELGVVGLTALLTLFVTGLVCARRLRRRTADAETRQLAQTLTAAVAGGACTFAFFDVLSFPQAAVLMFFMLGAIGALHRLHGQDGSAPAPDSLRLLE